MAPDEMDDQQLKNDMTTIASADQLEANGNLPPQSAAEMRNPALDRLYPRG